MRGLHQIFSEFQKAPLWKSIASGKEQNQKIDTSTKVNFGNLANTFKLECSVALASKQTHRTGGSGTFSGSYKLDNGDGLADYSDIEHKIWACNGPPDNHPSIHHWTIVGATGTTEFGRVTGGIDARRKECSPGFSRKA